MGDFNRLKPFELSLWKDKIKVIDEATTQLNNSSPNYIDIYEGLNTSAENLNFWYFPRNWTETYLTEDNGAVTLRLGKDDGASKEINSNFSTTALDFKPNSTYTIILIMIFNRDDQPNFNDFKILNPFSENFNIVELVKSEGIVNKTSFKTIFNSDIIISQNEQGFNINESNFVGEDEAFFVKASGRDQDAYYCICKLTTNNFLKEHNTIGMWTTFNCFSGGSWTANTKIQVIEGDSLYNALKSNSGISSNSYFTRLQNKSKMGLLNNEGTFLYLFQQEIKKEKIITLLESKPSGWDNNWRNYYKKINNLYICLSNDDLSQGETIVPFTANTYYKININNTTVQNCREEIENLNSIYSTNKDNDDFRINFYQILNKYFPFIPTYSTTAHSDMVKISNYKFNSDSEQKIFKEFFPSKSGSTINNGHFLDANNNSFDKLFSYIMDYILVIYNYSTITTTTTKINDNLIFEYIYLKLAVFYLNTNSRVKEIFNLIYREIFIAAASNYSVPLSIEFLNKYNVAIYVIMILMSNIDLVTKDNESYKLNEELVNLERGIVDLNPVVYTAGTFSVQGDATRKDNTSSTIKRYKYVTVPTKVIYVGYPRFGYYSYYTDNNNNNNNYIGFLPWLNRTVIPDIKTNITFNDIMKLMGQTITQSGFHIEEGINKSNKITYLQDYKVFVFGSNNFSDKSAAQEIQLKRSAKEIDTLTFSLYDNYFDREANSYINNPFIPYLKNESKLRLKYDDKWYDFTITNIQEDLMVNHKINYTAKDSNVLELSKIGFNKTFNTDLDNNIGTIGELAEKTLENLDWELDEDKTERLIQYIDQPIFIGKLKPGISVSIDDNKINFQDLSSAAAYSKFIILYYNEILEEKQVEDLHIITFEEDSEDINELLKNNTLNSCLIIDKINIYTLVEAPSNNYNFIYEEKKDFSYKIPSFIDPNNFKLYFTVRAPQKVCKPIMHYNKPLNRYVYEYEDVDSEKTYYGYEKKEYSTDSLIVNLLPHGQDFRGTENWYTANQKKKFQSSLDLSITDFNGEETVAASTEEGSVTEEESTLVGLDNNYSFLTFKTEIKSSNVTPVGDSHGFFINTDLTYNFDKLNSLTVNDEFALRIQLERSIDKAISSSSNNNNTDDQITLLEALVPCICSYSSTENIQTEGYSSVSEKDQLIDFWNEDFRPLNNKQVTSLYEKAKDSYLIPVYWAEDDVLPIFYTYKDTALSLGILNPLTTYPNQAKIYLHTSELKQHFYYFLKEKYVPLASQPNDWSNEWKKYYKKENGVYIKLSDDSAPNFTSGLYYEENRFKNYMFPIINDNTIESFSQANIYSYGREGENESIKEIIKCILLTAKPSDWDSNWRDYYKKSDNKYINLSDEDLSGEESIVPFIADTYYKNDIENITYCVVGYDSQWTEERGWGGYNKDLLEKYICYTENKGLDLLFEPENIEIEGINKGTVVISGLPLDDGSQYYNDFDLIMRARAIWKPIKYNPNGTCIFEAVGKYKGVPYYDGNGYSFKNFNYNYGDLLSKNIGLFFLIGPTIYDGKGADGGTSQLQISKVEFFRKYLNENGEVITPSDIIQSTTKTLYRLYDPNEIQNQTALVENDMTWAYQEYYLDDKYQKVIDEEGNKINSITITESNVYNILQKLAEIFDAWLYIDVKHNEDGSLWRDSETKKLSKKIYFKDTNYKDNFAGFKYGINLKNIQRQIDSNDIINKLIVKQNNNEYGTLGFSSITNSQFNISGSNTIFNFDYYISNGLIKAEDINSLLYEKIYPKTFVIGRVLTQIAKEKSDLKIKLDQVAANVQFYKTGCESIEEIAKDLYSDFMALTGKDYSVYVNDPSINKSDNPFNGYKDVNRFQRDIHQLAYYTKLLIVYKNNYTTSQTQYDDLVSQLSLYEQQKTGLVYQRDYLLNKIYKLYSSYLKEGSWISEDYIDDDLYYIDAEKKLNESCKPKVTYTIEVVDISNLPEWSAYSFDLRDKTYIEDPEIFGYDEYNRPYKEEIIITELNNHLQSPDKNTITVQNYKTQFDDLFQRMVSTIQAVEFGTGNYSNTNNALLKNKILNNEL